MLNGKIRFIFFFFFCIAKLIKYDFATVDNYIKNQAEHHILA